MTTKQLNIENRSYYFYNDFINVLNFEASDLKLDKKTWKNLDVYYIGYVDNKKSKDWVVNGVNPLYLMINRFYGHIEEKNGIKFLTINKRDSVLKKYDQVFKCIKKIDDYEVVYNSDYDKTKFLRDDSIPLNKLIYFPTIIVVISCVFKQNGEFYPQVYLDDCLYQI